MSNKISLEVLRKGLEIVTGKTINFVTLDSKKSKKKPKTQKKIVNLFECITSDPNYNPYFDHILLLLHDVFSELLQFNAIIEHELYVYSDSIEVLFLGYGAINVLRDRILYFKGDIPEQERDIKVCNLTENHIKQMVKYLF